MRDRTSGEIVRDPRLSSVAGWHVLQGDDLPVGEVDADAVPAGEHVEGADDYDDPAPLLPSTATSSPGPTCVPGQDLVRRHQATLRSQRMALLSPLSRRAI
jgi:hypothetical protein